MGIVAIYDPLERSYSPSLTIHLHIHPARGDHVLQNLAWT